MEFVLTSTTHGASGKELVSSAEEISRIVLVDFATKVESDLKTLWTTLRTPGQQHCAYDVVAAMKQHFQHVERLSNTVSSCATAVEAVQQVISKPVDVELSSCATAMETVQVVIGEPPCKLGMCRMASRLWCQSRSTQLALPLFLWGLFPW